jgi:hypothetical protein
MRHADLATTPIYTRHVPQDNAADKLSALAVRGVEAGELGRLRGRRAGARCGPPDLAPPPT